MSFFSRARALHAISFFIFLAAVFVFLPQITFAQEANDALGVTAFDGASNLAGTDIRVIVARIINIFLGLLSVIAVGIVIYGGITYMTAGGDEGKVEDARKILMNGAIGLVIVLSAFAISRFVLTRLQGATGLGQSDPLASCADLALANDPRYDELCGRTGPSLNCSSNPSWCCGRDNFIVQSITPRTETTNMNNATIRVVFSRGVRTAANQVVTITRDGEPVTDFSFRFADPANQVLEATYTGATVCAGTNGCMPSGEYRVSVRNTVVDARGGSIQESVACGNFPREATFRVNTPNTLDVTAPVIPGGISVDGVRANDQPLPVNREVEISVPMTDNTGAGYVRLDIGQEGRAASIVSVGGPTIARGSGTTVLDPFVYTYRLFLAANTRPGERYVVTATAYDIDGNRATASTTFVSVAAHCGNGVQDGDETDVDAGGSCQGVGQCAQNWQCASGQCVSGQCVSSPLITNVDPWDAAAGSWVTVSGRFFGTTPGQVQFGIDRDNSGTIAGAEWITAAPATCGGAVTWTDTYTVVEVPGDAALPQGSFSAIRIVRADNNTLTDTTIDSRGPRGGTRNGLFLKNTTNRPRLCRVEVGAGVSAGLPSTDARAIGQFSGGTNRELRFGLASAPVTSWADARVDTRVPAGLRPGVVSVAAVIDGVSSNAVPFTILSPDDASLPSITAIDPETTTPGSLITLAGRGFGGATGNVYFANDISLVCAPPNMPAGCVAAQVTLPPACGDTWTPESVVVQVPTTLAPGQWYVTVRTTNGLQTQLANTARLTVQAGTPRPGLCRISPARGPAPLAPASPGLTLTGVNFAAAATTYFWTRGAVANDVTTWLSTRAPEAQILTATQILTPIPERNGVTMQTGPIRVGSGGQLSNSLTYTVEDCRALPQSQIPAGLRCCTDGSFLPENQSCPGESRNAGYVWRFTTGQLSRLPQVDEFCEQGSSTMPSPTPDVQTLRGAACINAEINARFTVEMDPASVVANTRIYTCGNGTSANCSNRVNVTDQFDIRYENPNVVARPRGAGAVLTADTWYRVELGSGIRSNETREILSRQVTVNEPILATRPCGAGTAYCFTFQAGSRRCEIANAFIRPPTYTTNMLGMLQDPSYPRVTTNVLSPPHPFYYYVWGAPNEACTVIRADGLGWNWSVPAPGNAYARVLLDRDPPDFTDSRATVTALANSAPNTAQIRAVSSQPGAPVITAVSTLTVDLGDPRVVGFWPNCSESCTNAGIGIRFNQMMLPDTYPGAVRMYRCADALCAVRAEEIFFDVVEGGNPMLYRFAPPSQTPLLENTWYLVTVADTIRAQSAIGSTNPGNPLAPFSWRFRTKSSDGFCVAASVQVEPTPFTATTIGETTGYVALPQSSPDQCSALGQELNPWLFGWRWGSADPAVARVTTFSSLGSPRSQCTATCIPLGSTLAVGAPNRSMCGNGRIDVGEDCDVAANGEVVGTTCTLTCLRPGNTNRGTGPGQCGNATVEGGEECDPATGSPDVRFCNERCLRTGTSDRFTPGIATSGAPFCGDRTVSPGEECEPGVNGAVENESCTSTCLNIGVPSLAASWCESRPLVGTSAEVVSACRNRGVSICGDGVVNRGEACEIVTGNPGSAGTIRVYGEPNPIAVQDVGVCSSRCLLGNICSETTIPNTFRCDRNAEGCTENCTLRGSDISYGTPSLCGDGVRGIGEYAMCEYQPGDLGTRVPLGQNATQIVTAVGASTNIPADGRQETTIQAEAIATTGGRTLSVRGSGAYALQCGFEEYANNAPQANQYNNCPQNSGNALNRYGVGTNSCCQLRPERTSTYPADGTGFNGSEAACRNTLIEFTLSGEIDEASLQDNILIARGYAVGASAVPCQGTNDDVTTVVRGTLAYENPPEGFFRGTIYRVRYFFRALLEGQAFASALRPDQINVGSWCGGQIRFVPTVTPVTDASGVVTETRVRLQLTSLLDAGTTYAVLLQGGVNGIENTRGVGIRPDTNSVGTSASSWVFRTQTGDVCRVESVTVEPESYLFTAPNTSTDFIATARTLNNRAIAPIPGIYNWVWSWGPSTHPAFVIPAAGNTGASDQATVRSRNLGQGETGTLVAELRVTEDRLAATGTTLPRFSDTAELITFFCERPWPPRGIYPYEDGVSRGRNANNDDYTGGVFTGQSIPGIALGSDTIFGNVRFGYCADAGRTGDITDDLPYLRPSILGANGTSPIPPFGDSVRRIFFFNEKNDDAIGFQIFNNTTRAVGGSATPPPPPAAPNLPLPPAVTPDGGALRFVDSAATRSDFPIGEPVLIQWRGGQPGQQVRLSLLLLVLDDQGRYAYSNDTNGQIDLTGNIVNDGSAYITIPQRVLQPAPDSLYEIIVVEEGTQAQGFSTRFTLTRSAPVVPPVPVASGGPTVSSLRPLRQWYREKFGEVPSTMRSVTVDGYEALTDGNTYYINALNQYDESERNEVGSFVYLFTVNADASDNTKRVFTSLVNSIRFNINLSDVGYCSVGNGTDREDISTPDLQSNIACSVDSQCSALPGNRICANARTKMLRDWDRLQDASSFQNLALNASLLNGGRFPVLNSGTYIPGYTNSRWPSWGGTLAGALGGAIPSDPLNTWSGCDGIDPQTCWSPDVATFQCPASASMYEYSVRADGTNYQLHVPLEYFSGETGIVDGLLDTDRLSVTRWCVGTPQSPSAGVCGNGIINPGEECDNPANSRGTTTNGCSAGQIRTTECTNECRLVLGQCRATGLCGNGVIEAPEVCDDGRVNGQQYGRCNASCTGLSDLACGEDAAVAANLVIDVDPATNAPLEFCEKSQPQFQRGFCDKQSCRDPRFDVTVVPLLTPNPGEIIGAQSLSVLGEQSAWAVMTDTAQNRASIMRFSGFGWSVSRQETGIILRGITFLNAQVGFAVGAQTGGSRNAILMRTSNGGANWTTREIPNTSGVVLQAVHAVSPTMVYVAGTGENVWRTENAGDTWSQQSYAPLAANTSISKLQFIDQQTGFAYGTAGFFSTTNGGLTWVAQRLPENPATEQVDFVFANRNLGYLVTDASRRVFRTTDSGVTWTSLDLPAPDRAIVSSAGPSAIALLDAQTVVVLDRIVLYQGFSGQAGYAAWATNNGGERWVVVSTPNNNGFVRTIEFAPGNQIIGLFRGLNQFLRFTRSTYCAAATACDQDSQCSSGDSCVLTARPTYHPLRGASCSFDCQATGGYCGDSFVNEPHEECDDGNTDNLDSCSNLCFRRTNVVISNPNAGPFCGDGIVQSNLGETCDEADANGLVPQNPPYGQRVTLCSAECTTVTRDPITYCGDGIVQRDAGEVCDTLSTGGVTTSTIANGPALTCSRGTLPTANRGAFSCQNNCRRLVDNCTVCGVIETCSAQQGLCRVNGSSSQPSCQDALCSSGANRVQCAPGQATNCRYTDNTNPICTNGLDDDGDGLVDCADFTGGGANPRIAVINPIVDYAQSGANAWGQSTEVSMLRASSTAGFVLQESSSAGGVILRTWAFRGLLGSRLLTEEVSALFSFRQPGSVFAYPANTARLNDQLNINTNNLCTDVYHLDINRMFIGSYSRAFGQPLTPQRRGSLFPFPVNGEQQEVTREFVFSPAVPPNVFRVVLRWSGAEDDGRFLGRLYHNDFSPVFGRIIDFSVADTQTRLSRTNYLCNNISLQTLRPNESYWWSTGCTTFNTSDGTARVFVHPQIQLEDTFVKALTIDLSQAQTSAPFQYFVDDSVRPMGRYVANPGLIVEVYEYQQDQDSARSVYAPRVFRIRNIAGTSSNPNANYWHVFNIVRNQATGTYEIRPVGPTGDGSIETDIVDIHNNT